MKAAPALLHLVFPRKERRELSDTLIWRLMNHGEWRDLLDKRSISRSQMERLATLMRTAKTAKDIRDRFECLIQKMEDSGNETRKAAALHMTTFWEMLQEETTEAVKILRSKPQFRNLGLDIEEVRRRLLMECFFIFYRMDRYRDASLQWKKGGK